MTPILRQKLVALMLVLYGSVSLCGIGLHARNHETGGSHGSPHQPDTNPVVHADPDHDDPDHDDPNHCSLCKFHAQGQLKTEPGRVLSRPHTSPHVPLILAEAACRDRHPSCSPRAPPMVRLAVPATA